MNAKEVFGKVVSNKKLGLALTVVGSVLAAAGKGISTIVEKNEAKELIKQLVDEKLAGK